MSDWGKGVINNIGWGQGANNDIGWGSIYDKSNAGETLLLKDNKDNTAFIIEVKTDNTGTSSDDQFQFTGAEGDYDVVAKQNDTQVATFNDLSGQETITLPSSEIYVLEITPKEVNGFNRIKFNVSGDVLKMLKIKQWGNIVWSSFNAAFRGCQNLEVTANDIPNLSNVTSTRLMFFECFLFNTNISAWNVSNIIDMNSMLRKTAFNQNIGGWKVINVTDMSKILIESNLSVENLTAIYENWSQLNLQQNVSFSAGNTKYNASGQAGRDILVNTYNWIITDGGQV
jgi:surface protein